MDRDFDLVVTILGVFRDADAPTMSGREVSEAVHEADGSTSSPERVGHHLEILADAGLVRKLTEGATGQDAIWRITWKGYDALEQDDDDEDEEYDGEGYEDDDVELDD
jgi:DNA-binding transcriptional ArsR family regulator